MVRSMLLKRSRVPNQILRKHISLLNHLKTTHTYKKQVEKTPSKKQQRFFTKLIMVTENNISNDTILIYE